MAITGDGEIFVQALPMATQKCIDEFDGTWEEFLNWFGSYFFNFVRSKDALLQFNTKDECSELLYDFDGDGVYDDAPILGDADGDGVPYQPGDIYQILWHINDIATSEHGVRRYNRGYVPNSEGEIFKKKQFAALLALSTAAACVLSYQPVQAGAESVLGSMTQENLTDITNEQ